MEFIHFLQLLFKISFCLQLREFSHSVCRGAMNEANIGDGFTKQKWRKFLNEYKPMMEWLEKIEQLVYTAETKTVSLAEKMLLFKVKHSSLHFTAFCIEMEDLFFMDKWCMHCNLS